MAANAPAPEARPFRIAGDHMLLAVRATPRAGRDAVERVETLADGRAALRVRLKAAPVEGEANEALRRFLGKALGVRPSAIAIDSGETARLKILRLPREALGPLEALVEQLQEGS